MAWQINTQHINLLEMGQSTPSEDLNTHRGKNELRLSTKISFQEIGNKAYTK